ncbi:Nif3-like dinuclear metal center hexameric protein [Phycisphaera mikurensis]|uniref:GTP cyclohydrolase 1 type 2 homolog n=1 Tax=Phycisphaera mikurensis (strain NBRC 102666 / KCTC 22515 / FYK2301M01) TaxID=1142394 RepID=I0IE18_PHYMF|nr:Nif3-like dinuclear metal center hexameric protein [Phycisphaera mikurensis]MBB6441313.1 dinuclear metal center YbgI/SA1388 family protein [Phycisphaera mikurensis]BAM03506.1 hypothetical protein PSMK_13470 [Phycisphaera mikurensis NBRC 102666]
MRLDDLITALAGIAPEANAGSWDRVGLQVGDPAADVAAGMLCIDLTPAVAAEAAAAGCGLVVAYHPPVFEPLRSLRADAGWAQRRVWDCVHAHLAVYSPHTALDAVRGGVCDWLAERCGAGVSVPLEPAAAAGGAAAGGYKLVVFVPAEAEAALRSALWAAGAGAQGRYDRCWFSSAGEGGFRPLEGAEPAIGAVGEQATVAERRVEVLVPGTRLSAVLAALRAAHPYEEPAFDLLRREPEPADPATQPGAGRLLTLAEPATLAELAGRVGRALGVPLKVGGDPGLRVGTVAACPGSGGKLFEGVDADLYLTGEMQHHQALDLVQRGRGVVLGGHTNTERPYLPVYREKIRATAAGALRWEISEADAAPLRWDAAGAR